MSWFKLVQFIAPVLLWVLKLLYKTFTRVARVDRESRDTHPKAVASLPPRQSPPVSLKKSESVQKMHKLENESVPKRNELKKDDTRWQNIEKITSDIEFRKNAARGRKNLGVAPWPGDEELLKDEPD